MSSEFIVIKLILGDGIVLITKIVNHFCQNCTSIYGYENHYKLPASLMLLTF